MKCMQKSERDNLKKIMQDFKEISEALNHRVNLIISSFSKEKEIFKLNDSNFIISNIFLNEIDEKIRKYFKCKHCLKKLDQLGKYLICPEYIKFNLNEQNIEKSKYIQYSVTIFSDLFISDNNYFKNIFKILDDHVKYHFLKVIQNQSDRGFISHKIKFPINSKHVDIFMFNETNGESIDFHHLNIRTSAFFKD